MAPLVVQVLSTLLARWFLGWRDAARAGLPVMFLFTATSVLDCSPVADDTRDTIA